jgi:hypothetical protein
MFNPKTFRPARDTSEYAEEAERMSRDVPEMHDGRFLRDEACRLVVWFSRNSATEAQHYFVAERDKLRASAAKLKAAIEARGLKTAKILDQIFQPTFGCEFAEDVVRAARAELEI